VEKLQVLIIDDDKETAGFFSTVLTMVGLDCEIVLSAKEALIMLSVSVPDVILLDMRLGFEISGEDILYQIRSNPRFDNTRVVVITAYPTIAEMVTNLADLTLIKPVEVDQLKTLVERLDALEVAPKHLPFRDPVTQLFNKEFFYSRLDLAVERSKRRQDFYFAVAILSVAIDNENDLRLDIQKAILGEVAARLKRYLRPTDTISRFSGRKFATLNEELKNPTDIRVVTNRMQEILAEPVHVGNETYRLVTSIGAVVFNRRYKEPRAIVDAAEHALEAAKISGQASVCIVEEQPVSPNNPL
jgi:diguanylate cyclase (GGDEF)-like protein